MFKTHPDSMRMEPTPERVYAVCKLIASQSMSKDDVRKYMSLGEPSSTNYGEIMSSITVAVEELGVLTSKDNLLVLNVPISIIETPTAFRRYVNSKVFGQKDSTFVLFCKWYIAQNERIFILDTWEVKANTAKDELHELAGLNENAALGWRFWAAFLGIGYLSGTSLIPNMKIRLQDVMVSSFSKAFQYNEPVQANAFVEWISAMFPEIELTSPLPLAISAGLRTLHELGLIELESRRDTERTKLYFVDGDMLNDFSHITVKEAIIW